MFLLPHSCILIVWPCAAGSRTSECFAGPIAGPLPILRTAFSAFTFWSPLHHVMIDLYFFSNLISVCSSNQKISAVNRLKTDQLALYANIDNPIRPAFCRPSWGQHHSTWTLWDECTWPAKKGEWCETKLPCVDFGLFGCKMLHCGITNGDDMHSPAGSVCEKGKRMPHVACLATRPREMAVLVDGPYNFRRHFSIASEPQAPSWTISLSCLESSELNISYIYILYKYIWIISWHGIALRTVSGVHRVSVTAWDS